MSPERAPFHRTKVPGGATLWSPVWRCRPRFVPGSNAKVQSNKSVRQLTVDVGLHVIQRGLSLRDNRVWLAIAFAFSHREINDVLRCRNHYLFESYRASLFWAIETGLNEHVARNVCVDCSNQCLKNESNRYICNVVIQTSSSRYRDHARRGQVVPPIHCERIADSYQSSEAPGQLTRPRQAIMTPIYFIGFLVSLRFVDAYYTKARTHWHDGSSDGHRHGGHGDSRLPAWLHRLLFRPTGYEYRVAGAGAAAADRWRGAGEDSSAAVASGSEATAGSGGMRDGRWYVYEGSSQRKLLKVEAEDAFAIRSRVLAVMAVLALLVLWAVWAIVRWLWRMVWGWG